MFILFLTVFNNNIQGIWYLRVHNDKLVDGHFLYINTYTNNLALDPLDFLISLTKTKHNILIIILINIRLGDFPPGA